MSQVPSNSPVAGSQAKAASAGAASASSGVSLKTIVLLALLPCAYLWYRLIHNLDVEWSTNPQYSYGYLVPFLCLGLLMRRWQSAPKPEVLGGPPITLPILCSLAVCCFAFLYLPTRLIEGSTPEWRPIQWLLGVEAIGLTLCMVYLLMGRGWLSEFAFPICLFFVAVPWPTLIEQPIIQGLTRVSGAIVVEIVGNLGIPALQRGNLIQISQGTLGIDEACSGIRSFQTSFMICFFFGEFYRLNWLRRLLLLPITLLLAMAFNVARMTFLTMVASDQGIKAISKYHDPAGVSIAIACTLVMWCVAVLLLPRKSAKSAADKQPAPAVAAPQPKITDRILSARITKISIALIVWLALVEAGVEAWYHHLEAGFKPGPDWTVVFPSDNPTFQQPEIPADTKELLRYDSAQQATWSNPDGSFWKTFYCEWNPGRVAGYLAKRHTPEICLPATGFTMKKGPELMVVNIHGIELPVRQYIFEQGGQLLQVFHCRWDAGATAESYTAHDSARFNLIRGIWAGRGTHGQKVVASYISGIDDPEVAKKAFLDELEQIIKVQPAAGDSKLTQAASPRHIASP